MPGFLFLMDFDIRVDREELEKQASADADLELSELDQRLNMLHPGSTLEATLPAPKSL